MVHIYIYVCIYMYMNVCMYVCMYVCMFNYLIKSRQRQRLQRGLGLVALCPWLIVTSCPPLKFAIAAT